jgi:hypothetical protein
MLPNNTHRFRFNSENAREMAARSSQARRDRKAKLEAEAATGRLATPQSERLAKQIGAIEALMDGQKNADILQKLSAAHARLFTAWQVLTGTPNPGSRKAGKSRSPVQPLPDPEPIPAAESSS